MNYWGILRECVKSPHTLGIILVFIKNGGFIIRSNLKTRFTASKRFLGLPNALKALFLTKIISILTFCKGYRFSKNEWGLKIQPGIPQIIREERLGFHGLRTHGFIEKIR